MKQAGHQIHCKNCAHPISGNYCKNCGQATTIGRIDFQAFVLELFSSFFNYTKRLPFTLLQMLTNPGASMLEYLGGARKKYQSPISYFVSSLVLYFLYVKYILPSFDELKNLKITTDEISHSTAGTLNGTPGLTYLLLGMSAIGWLVCGLNWGEKGKRPFNFYESVVVFAYIYGTNFFLDPIIVTLEIPLLRIIMQISNNKETLNLLTDIPLIVVIALMALSFCREAKIRWYRYAITLLIGLIYYKYMTGLISPKQS